MPCRMQMPYFSFHYNSMFHNEENGSVDLLLLGLLLELLLVLLLPVLYVITR